MPITIEQKKDILELAGYEFEPFVSGNLTDSALWTFKWVPDTVQYSSPTTKERAIERAWYHYSYTNTVTLDYANN